MNNWLFREGTQLSVVQRATHTYVIGQPGMGKSRALESWIMQDILAGRGVGVIDPHGDLYRHLVFRLAILLQSRPELAERVILIDPTDPVWTVGFNPLQAGNGMYKERLAWLLTDVIIKIWRLDTATAPRMLRLLTFSFLALSEFQLTLLDLPRFLLDEAWRKSLLSRTRHPEITDYFNLEFPKGASAVHQWAMPVLNKIGPLIFDPEMRLMLATESTINFRKILDRNQVLLVNLPKGILGEGNSALLGAFIVAHLQQAALSRANSWERNPFFLYLDEFQNYTTDNIKDILSESRKYALSLVMAHQYLAQLAEDLRGAVLNTAGTIVCFRIGYHDANELCRDLFIPGSLKATHHELNFAHLAGYHMPYFQERTEPLDREALA